MTEEKKEIIKNQSKTEVSKKVEDIRKVMNLISNEKILSTKKTEEKKSEKTNDTSNLSNNKADRKEFRKINILKTCC